MTVHGWEPLSQREDGSRNQVLCMRLQVPHKRSWQGFAWMTQSLARHRDVILCCACSTDLHERQCCRCRRASLMESQPGALGRARGRLINRGRVTCSLDRTMVTTLINLDGIQSIHVVVSARSVSRTFKGRTPFVARSSQRSWCFVDRWASRLPSAIPSPHAQGLFLSIIIPFYPTTNCFVLMATENGIRDGSQREGAAVIRNPEHMTTRRTRYRVPRFLTGAAIFTSICWVRGLQLWISSALLPGDERWRGGNARTGLLWFALPLALPIVAAVVFLVQLVWLIWQFPESPDAAARLRADLERARRALVERGFRFDAVGVGVPTAATEGPPKADSENGRT